MRRGSVRIEGIPRDRPGVDPSEPPIQVLPGGTSLCVQCQEAEPRALRLVFDRSHQPSADSLAAAAAMHQQLHDLRTMRLVRCPGWVELDGSDDAFGIAGGEEDCSRVGCRDGPAPPVFGVLAREGREKLTAAPDSTASTKSSARARRSESFTGGTNRSMACACVVRDALLERRCSGSLEPPDRRADLPQ